MNKRPLTLTLYAIAMLCVAVSMPIQAMLLQDFEHAWKSLTWLNITVSACCFTLAISILNAHISARVLLPMTIAIVALNNWWVGYVALDFSMEQTTWASMGFMGLSSMLLEKNAFRVLYDPKLKWWSRSPRIRTQVPVVLFPWQNGNALRKSSFDLSDTGIFVQGFDDEEFDRYQLGQKFQIRVVLQGHSVISCTGKLVRKTQAAGSYPAGVGLSFEGLGWLQKRQIRRMSRESSLEM